MIDIIADAKTKATKLTEQRLDALKRGDVEAANKLWGEIVPCCRLQILAASEDVEGVRG